jgi:hypothetical protein
MWDTIDLEYDPTAFTEVDNNFIKILYDTRAIAGMTHEELFPVYMNVLK